MLSKAAATAATKSVSATSSITPPLAASVSSVARRSLFKGIVNSSSLITYHLGETESACTVIDLVEGPGHAMTLFLDKTPFHPVDPHWPDQPADIGALQIQDIAFNVIDCRILGVHKESKEIRETTDIAKKEKHEWHFVVGHVIDNPESKPPVFFQDSDAIAKVNETFRQEISLHHSACHLAAFALNMGLKDFWKKAVDPADNDSLGSPNFDSLAMEKSLIFTDRSEDTYRFGKSLKKKGFDVEKLEKEIGAVETNVNGILQSWIGRPSQIGVTAEGPHLDDRRMWNCDLGENGKAELPCGGTHVPSLLFMRSINYKLQLVDDTETKERKLLAVTKAGANTDEQRETTHKLKSTLS